MPEIDGAVSVVQAQVVLIALKNCGAAVSVELPSLVLTESMTKGVTREERQPVIVPRLRASPAERCSWKSPRWLTSSIVLRYGKMLEYCPAAVAFACTAAATVLLALQFASSQSLPGRTRLGSGQSEPQMAYSTQCHHAGWFRSIMLFFVKPWLPT